MDLNILSDLKDKALGKGADAADVVAIKSTSLYTSFRLGKVERLERSEMLDIGLRVFKGKKIATISGTKVDAENLDNMADQALAMVEHVPEDEFAGLAESDRLIDKIPKLNLCDTYQPEASDLLEKAKAAEEAALSVEGVSNSEGADASWSMDEVHMVASNGFSGGYKRSSHSLSASVLAGEGTGMERDYDYDVTIFANDLKDAEEIGKRAGHRAVRRLNPQKIESCKMPVIYHTRVGRSLLGHLAGAINGASIARGTSFLIKQMGEDILPENLSVIDDPYLEKGLRSRPFDGEGVEARKRPMIENGVLKSWFLDCRSARQLNLSSTGHASRGTGGLGSPSPTNLYLTGGDISRDELLKSAGRAFLVTDMMGSAVSLLTGDYSRGASGFIIEDGEIVSPVSEVTIAGNLRDMYKTLQAANDLEHRFGMDVPTLMVPEMTIAGL